MISLSTEVATAMFAGIAALIAVISLAVTKKQLAQTQAALKDAKLLTLFSGFDQANVEVMKDPSLLVSVHGMDEEDADEQKKIAYLAILIDAFHHYWGKEYGNDGYRKVLDEETNFIHNIVAVKDNYPRWKHLRSINYGQADEEFIKVMDELFKRGQENSNNPEQEQK